MSLFFLLARNYYKRTKCPFFAQCKATQNKIAWAHCMFLQITSLSCLVTGISSSPNYGQFPTPVIAAKIADQVVQCLMCSQSDIDIL